MLTIVSPCILPVLPFVFARADRPFVRSGLPLLVGMAVTFAGVATLAAVGGGWAVQANQYGRVAALALLAAVRADAAVSRARRPADAAAGRRWARGFRNPPAQAADAAALDRAAVAAARRRDRAAVGALRRADPRPDPDRRGAAGRERETSLLLLAYAAGAATSLALALSSAAGSSRR